jgi:hypothetical protein
MRTIVVGRDPAAVDMGKSVDHARVVNRASRRLRRQHVAAAVADLRRT